MHKYLQLKYKSGARGENGYIDCWGLTRLARAEIYNKHDLPVYSDAKYICKGGIHAGYTEQSKNMQQCEPKAGAVIAVMRKGVCIHTAIMLENNDVLEIKRDGLKSRVTPWREFLKQYPEPAWEVKTYD